MLHFSLNATTVTLIWFAWNVWLLWKTVMFEDPPVIPSSHYAFINSTKLAFVPFFYS